MSRFMRFTRPVLALGLALGALALTPGASPAETPGSPERGEGTLRGTMDLGGVTVYYAVHNFNAIPDGYLDWTVQVEGDDFPIGVAVQERRFNSETNQEEWVTIAEAGDLQDTTAQVTFPENDRSVRFIFVGARPGRYTWHAYQ